MQPLRRGDAYTDNSYTTSIVYISKNDMFSTLGELLEATEQ